MVELGSALRAKDGTTPLSARYHLFLRATEGAFTCLSRKGPHVQLARHDDCPDCDAPVFEIGSCKRCGAVHVLGTPTPEGGVMRLRPRKAGSKGTWLVLSEQAALTDEDEEAVADDGVEVTADDAKLCTGCGAIGETRRGQLLRLWVERPAPGAQAQAARRGDRWLPRLRRARLRDGPRLRDRIRRQRCRHHDLALPEPPAQPRPSRRPDAQGRDASSSLSATAGKPAAYFAPYLEDSYGRLQRRRLIAEGLLAAHADEEPVAIDDVVFKTRAAATEVKHFPGGMTAQQQARIVAPWVMAEVLATDDRQSLEGLGLVSMTSIATRAGRRRNRCGPWV